MAKKKIYTTYVYMYDAWDEERMNPREIIRESFDTLKESEDEFERVKGVYKPSYAETYEYELWEGEYDPEEYDDEDFELDYVCDDDRAGDLISMETTEYDAYDNLDDAVIIDWKWKTYIGYSRNFLRVRTATSKERTELDLLNGNHERTGAEVSEKLCSFSEIEGECEEDKAEWLANLIHSRYNKLNQPYGTILSMVAEKLDEFK